VGSGRLPPPGADPDDAEGALRALRRTTHRTIASVTEALETFAFNVAVARVHEFANAIGGVVGQMQADVGAAGREALETMARLVAPMMPHLAEELWRMLRPGADENAPLVAELPWPEANPVLLKAKTLTLAVQVLGKLRGTIEVPADADEAAVLAAAEAEENVRRAIGERPIRKRIHVPGRVVNFVV